MVGYPVAHSRSPFIHAAFARQTGETLEYGRIECAPGEFARVVVRFAGEGGRGCNVTVPYKFDALAMAPRCSPRARLAGAANTLRFDADGWWADNTDGIGLVRDLEQHAGRSLAGLRILLIGAGGAAAGVLGPILDAAPREVVVVNRGADRARALGERHQSAAAGAGVELQVRRIEDPGNCYDVVINATASSLQGAAVPVPSHVLAAGTLAVDLMYGEAAAPFIDWARRHGAEGRDGLGMLVEQAAESFFDWRGIRPQTAEVLRALRGRLAVDR